MTPSSAENQLAESALAIVATPIGNLGDITIRALEALRGASLIACEDTRHTVRLLQHHQVKAPLISLNEHNEARRIPEIIGRIQAGEKVALVSDAGMPAVSDPGQRLIHAVIAAGLRVEVLPGPSAVLAALVGSGLPVAPFHFGGFLPHKKGARTAELSLALGREASSVYFESPYRIADTLEIVAGLSPAHQVVVARELTKKFEEYQRGTAGELLDHFRAHPPKGEITLVIAPRELPKWMTRGSQAGET